MNVRELIEQLSALPLDAEVRLPTTCLNLALAHMQETTK